MRRPRSGRRPVRPRAVGDRSELDRWLLSQLNTLVQTVRDALDDYDAMVASRAVEDFFDGLSNWYIRLSRQRFWAPGGNADPAAMATLHDALVTVTKLLAPFLPFLAEEIYQNLVRGVEPSAAVSVHHTAYPQLMPVCAIRSWSGDGFHAAGRESGQCRAQRRLTTWPTAAGGGACLGRFDVH